MAKNNYNNKFKEKLQRWSWYTKQHESNLTRRSKTSGLNIQIAINDKYKVN